MKEKVSHLIFSATLGGSSGGYSEVVITDADDVYFTCRSRPGAPLRTDAVRKRRREIDELLRQVERLGVVEWEPCYGPEEPTGPEGWHVVLDVNGKLYRRRGSGEYPPGWGELRRLLEGFLGQPFGADRDAEDGQETEQSGQASAEG